MQLHYVTNQQTYADKMCFYEDAVKHILSALPGECAGSLRKNIWRLKINFDLLSF